MTNDALRAHSLSEAYLYLMATVCPGCGGGPLRGSEARVGEVQPGASSMRQCHIDVTCRACGNVTVMTFLVPAGAAGDAGREGAVVNPTDEPSHLLDVGQWIMLFRVIAEAASKETSRGQARHLGLEAAQCLDEALKFYEDLENDLPPSEAIFTEPSRQRFERAPEQFSRRRLLELRAKLPSEAAMRSRLSARRKKPWWRWWR